MSSRHLVYGLAEEAEVFYVGRSSSGLHRPKRHLAEGGREWRKDDPCHRRVRAMVRAGRAPEVVVLEEVPAGPGVDYLLALAETRWLARLRAEGHPILNSTLLGSFGGNGRRLSPLHRKRIREALKGRRWRKDNPNHFLGAIPMKKPVLCVELGIVYLSREDAANHLGIPQQNVGKAANGVREEAGGYSFEDVSICGIDFPRPTRKKRGRKRKTVS